MGEQGHEKWNQQACNNGKMNKKLQSGFEHYIGKKSS